MGLQDRIVAHTTRVGVFLILIGIVLLLGLRFWANPLTRQIFGREPVGFLDFLAIPVFFILVGVGIALFLWEPEKK